MTPVYWLRVFPSATGHTWFQVMGPFGRVYESLDRADAERVLAARIRETTPMGGM